MYRSVIIGVASAIVVLVGACALLQCRSNLQTKRALADSGPAIEFVNTYVNGAVNGRVTFTAPPTATRPSSPVPCAGAAVTLIGPSGSRTVYASSAGAYAFTGLYAGTYRIQAHWNGRSSPIGTLNISSNRPIVRNIAVQ